MAYIFNHDECTFTELVCEFKTENKHLKSKIKQIKKLGLIKIEKNNEKGDIKIYATKDWGFSLKNFSSNLFLRKTMTKLLVLVVTIRTRVKKLRTINMIT